VDTGLAAMPCDQSARLQMQNQSQLHEQTATDKQAETHEQQGQNKLTDFLARSGFKGIEEKKVKKVLFSRSYYYPLHAAVRTKDPELVALLLSKGINTSLRDSNGRTGEALAMKLNTAGSHQAVLDVLRKH